MEGTNKKLYVTSLFQNNIAPMQFSKNVMKNLSYLF